MGSDNTFDAIVIGSGISGGWAAKELCEKGLKTLVLERGRDVVHIKDYPTANLAPWEFRHRLRMTAEYLRNNPYISESYGVDEATAHFFIRDKDHPYIQEKPFEWIRGYQVGGKSLTWGRACQRWSKYEFINPERFGYGMAWPIGYDDVAPWYSHVEEFIGVCGNKDGLESMPDGEFLPPFEMNCVEDVMSRKIRAAYSNRRLVHARWAHLTEPKKVHYDQGRVKCQARNLCMRGCPFGGYFSSNSSTLPWAEKTGNLTIRPFSVVQKVLFDEQQNRASGVRVIDTNTKEVIDYKAKVIFMNASALNTNLILLNSTSSRFPHGLGNDNGLLGKYVAFQNYRASLTADVDGFLDHYYFGRNPTDLIVANYKNLHRQETDYFGGYTTFLSARRGQADTDIGHGIGAEYKESMCEPGGWKIYMYLQGETVPKITNHVRLSPDQKDQWGIPLLITSVAYDDNDQRMIDDFHKESKAMLEIAGCTNIQTWQNQQAPGLDIHEMGGCRMGKDPKTSLLNKWNQLHLCRNVFVTDGACMTTTGNQSPSILYMALTARAANHAADQIKSGDL